MHRGYTTKLKKVNAVLSLLTTFALLVHMGYSAFSYLTLYYNPALKALTAMPFFVCACLHGVLGMCAVFFQGDGTRLEAYWRQNRQTVVQRISAALIFPLLIVHLKAFALLEAFAGDASWVGFAIVVLIQIAFFVTVILHVAVSFSKALITLGVLGNRDAQRRLDRVVYTICAILLIIAVFAVVRGELTMFLAG